MIKIGFLTFKKKPAVPKLFTRIYIWSDLDPFNSKRSVLGYIHTVDYVLIIVELCLSPSNALFFMLALLSISLYLTQKMFLNIYLFTALLAIPSWKSGPGNSN